VRDAEGREEGEGELLGPSAAVKAGVGALERGTSYAQIWA
jgi:hypothetical protein